MVAALIRVLSDQGEARLREHGQVHYHGPMEKHLGALLSALPSEQVPQDGDHAALPRRYGGPVSRDTALERAVRESLGTAQQRGSLVGAQYLALTAEQTLTAVQLGVCDAATQRLMAHDTRQMAYSITKAITAIAALQLVEAGALSLEQPISQLLPEQPYGSAVTLRQLLAHSAGIPSPAPLSWFTVEGEALDGAARLQEILRAHPRLAAAPGTRYRYSNLGYWLVEKLIEAASGQDFAAFFTQRIFRPLGVGDLIAFVPPAVDMAVGHTPRLRPMGLLLRALTPARYWLRSAGRWRRAARVIPYGRGYGGLFCTATALAPVLADLLRPRPTLLSAASRDEMFSPQRLASGEPTGAALGWACGVLNSARYLGKQGGGLGFHGNIRVYPERGLATVLLCNVTEVSAAAIDRRSDAIDALVLGTAR